MIGVLCDHLFHSASRLISSVVFCTHGKTDQAGRNGILGHAPSWADSARKSEAKGVDKYIPQQEIILQV